MNTAGLHITGLTGTWNVVLVEMIFIDITAIDLDQVGPTERVRTPTMVNVGTREVIVMITTTLWAVANVEQRSTL